jgi:hypothetical protein
MVCRLAGKIAVQVKLSGGASKPNVSSLGVCLAVVSRDLPFLLSHLSPSVVLVPSLSLVSRALMR